MGMTLFSCFFDSIILLWYNRKNNNSFLVLDFIICYISLIMLTITLDQFDYPTFLYRVFPNFIVYVLLFLIISQRREWKKIILKTLSLIFCMLFSELSTMIIVMIGVRNSNLEALLTNTVFGIISLLIARIVEIILLHLINIFSQTDTVKKNIKWHFLSIGVVLIYLYMVVYCFIKDKIDYSLLGVAFISNIIFLIVILFIYFIYLNTLKEMEYQRKEIRILKEKSKREIEYYKEVDNLNQRIRKIYHDLKNHILIADSVKEKGMDEEYLKSLEEYFGRYSVKINSGNSILDILLEKKCEECKDKKIGFKLNVDFSKGDFINLVDLGTIFGNIIDNAIEACERIKDNELKEIRLVVGEVENFIMIKISNPVGMLRKEDGKLFSLKRLQKEEGLGLVCLQEVLIKYNGSYSYEIKDDFFNLTIIIPNKQ